MYDATNIKPSNEPEHIGPILDRAIITDDIGGHEVTVSAIPKVGGDSPWGTIVDVEFVSESPSIVRISTSSHGGIWVHPTLNRQVPAKIRLLSFNSQACSGWYEEDCDALIAMVYFPEYFKNIPISREEACRALDHMAVRSSKEGRKVIALLCREQLS